MSQSTAPTSSVRYIGVVADGATDREIMARFLKSILERTGPCQEVMTGKSLAPPMSEFRDKSSRTGQYGLFDKPARKLRKAIPRLIHSAVREFRDAIPRDLSHSDLLVLSTDAEWPIQALEDWHACPRIVTMYHIFDCAIAQFYNEPGNRQNWEYLPMIVPLVLFPSTDVLVASARGASFEFRGMKPPDLKHKLYGCTDLSQLRPDDLETKALRFLTSDACNQLYADLPEARTLLRTLTWACGGLPQFGESRA